MARDLVNQADARLFGARTAGCSSAKRTWTFPSGIASVSLSTRSRYGIDGKLIEFNGISPHDEVEADPKETLQGLNSPLLRAQEWVITQSARTTQ